MKDLIEASGIFIYPLGLCSIIAVFIVIERLLALRPGKVVPIHIQNDIIEKNSLPPGEADSVAGRILLFHQQRHPDADQIKAFGKMEVLGMERGLFLLDVVISAAPLLGLLGTVTGLVRVFSKVSPETGVPEPQAFVTGVSLALATTVVGLAIAIPAIVFNSYMNRRVEMLAARLNVLVERIVTIDTKNEAEKAARSI
ncbi:MAG: MotA/TolQ/ExbB proton channel family protein [Opitutales bacterium]|nr:MotA/TolQ/ExbB proton channel family protein [Opitutales bacterium]